MDELVFDGSFEIRQSGRSRTLSGSFPYGKMATVRNRGRRRKERFEPFAFAYAITEFDRLNRQLSELVQTEAAAGDLQAVLESRAADMPPRIEQLRQALERTNIHLLVGHDFNRPLGDLISGNLRIEDTQQGVNFEVDLPDENRQTSWSRDAITAVETGLFRGLSPGFNVPPLGVVPNAEQDIAEPGNPGVTIRSVKHAVLYEMSLVARPAYSETGIDVRADAVAEPSGTQRLPREVLTWL